MNYFLQMRWSVSSERETEGYNVCTLIDKDRKFSACGGGYDLEGTVFAEWLESTFYADLCKLQPCVHNKHDCTWTGLYGLHVNNEGNYYLNGSCGLPSMLEIARALNLQVFELREHGSGVLLGFFVIQRGN